MEKPNGGTNTSKYCIFLFLQQILFFLLFFKKKILNLSACLCLIQALRIFFLIPKVSFVEIWGFKKTVRNDLNNKINTLK